MEELSELLIEGEKVLWSGEPVKGARKKSFKYQIFMILIIFIPYYIPFFMFLFLVFFIFTSFIMYFLVSIPVNIFIIPYLAYLSITAFRKNYLNSIKYFITNKRISIKAEGKSRTEYDDYHQKTMVYDLKDDNILSSQDFSNHDDIYFIHHEKIDVIEVCKSPSLQKEKIIYFTYFLENGKRNIFSFSQISKMGNLEQVLSENLSFKFSNKTDEIQSYFRNKKYMCDYLKEDEIHIKEYKSIAKIFTMSFILGLIFLFISVFLLIFNSLFFSTFRHYSLVPHLLNIIMIFPTIGSFIISIFYSMKYFLIKKRKMFDIKPNVMKY